MNPSGKKLIFGILLGYTTLLLAACFWPFNFFQENRAERRPEGLVFSEPGIAYTTGGGKLEELTEFTCLAELSASIPGQASWIISYGLDFDHLNFLVGLYVDHLIVETRRGGQMIRASIKGGLQRERRTWLAVVGAPGLLRVYLDGVLVRDVTRDQPDATAWNAGYPLVLGSRSDAKYPWQGVLQRLAFFNAAFSPAAVRCPDSLMASNPVVSYELTGERVSEISNQGSGDTGPLVIPDRLIPVRRSSLMDIGDLWGPRPVWSDIILNVLAFVPLGVMLAVLLRRALHPLAAVILVLAGAFGLSLCIEMLQAYLPRRWSTFSDVAANSTGALLGAVLGLLVHRALRRKAVSQDRNPINQPTG